MNTYRCGWYRLFGIGLTGLIFVLSGCATKEIKEPALILSVSLDAPTQDLEREDGLNYLLVDDVNGDGRPDITAVSHSQSFVKTYSQVRPRSFQVGDARYNVGFHPDRLNKLVGCEGGYLMNAEGADRLLIMRWDGDRGLDVVAGREHKVPFSSLAFQWPNWGATSVAVAPYAGMLARDPISRTLWLLRGLDCETAAIEKAYALTKPRDSVPGRPVFADVDGDGIGEIIYTTHRTGAIWMVRHPDPGMVPEPELLHKFRELAPRHVAVDDLDGDGDLDLLVPLDPSGAVGVLSNNGTGKFSYTLRIPLGEAKRGPQQVATAMDKDGARYIVGVATNELVLLRFESPGLRSYEQLRMRVGGPVSDFALRDMDGDGWLDLVVVTDGVPLSIIYGPLRDHPAKLTNEETP